jgi:CheY-like chemotaxis protein
VPACVADPQLDGSREGVPPFTRKILQFESRGVHNLFYKGMLLLVDDDPTFLETAQDELELGRGIFLAATAEQAKSLMQSIGTGFSVALIDLDLPGQDGFSLIREMRQRFPEIPIIAISGVVQGHVLESAKVLGAKAILRKPITSEWHSVIQRARANR